MEQRERLIELLKNGFTAYGKDFLTDLTPQEFIADFLLANGVVVPPCKLGDTVYYITGIHNTLVKSAKVEEIYCGESGFAFHLCLKYTYFTLQQEDVFLSREEAEREIERRNNEQSD